jgi:hypothetical protein
MGFIGMSRTWKIFHSAKNFTDAASRDVRDEVVRTDYRPGV